MHSVNFVELLINDIFYYFYYNYLTNMVIDIQVLSLQLMAFSIVKDLESYDNGNVSFVLLFS